jgi:hypothetical protein
MLPYVRPLNLRAKGLAVSAIGASPAVPLKKLGGRF